ncbi:MAG: hypothetical protein V3U27_04060 [Candidatus Tectomicrobia bacterium]
MTRPWLMAAGVISCITVGLELVYRPDGHSPSWWHALPTFDLILGFLGCIVIVVVSKWLGHTWLQRDETYYGNEQS